MCKLLKIKKNAMNGAKPTEIDQDLYFINISWVMFYTVLA